jgi:hypothetical protein
LAGWQPEQAAAPAGGSEALSAGAMAARPITAATNKHLAGIWQSPEK